jgi:putative peptide zinc metalloprotease protein
VAVAFQVVLMVGSVDVVVPQNLSTAVNYACLECVTYALATQLVVTVPGPLSDAATQELAAIWAELQAFGKQIEGVPLAELRSRLTDFEARILDLVRPDVTENPGGVPETSGATDGSSSSGGPTSASRSSAPGSEGSEDAAPTTATTTTAATTTSGATSASPTTDPAQSSSAAGTAPSTAEATPAG